MGARVEIRTNAVCLATYFSFLLSYTNSSVCLGDVYEILRTKRNKRIVRVHKALSTYKCECECSHNQNLR